jgi:hypothetical protein
LSPRARSGSSPVRQTSCAPLGHQTWRFDSQGERSVTSARFVPARAFASVLTPTTRVSTAGIDQLLDFTRPLRHRRAPRNREGDLAFRAQWNVLRTGILSGSHRLPHAGKTPPRLRLAPRAVPSPGPRLAGTPSTGKKKGERRALPANADLDSRDRLQTCQSVLSSCQTVARPDRVDRFRP